MEIVSDQIDERYTIMMDHRENAEILLQELRNVYQISISVKQLKLGDYQVYPNTTIERKTIDDFCLSIIDGRLFRQAYRLAQYTENPIFIVEGETFTKRQYDITLDAIKGAFVSLAQTFRIPLLRSRDQKESAWYMNSLLDQRRRIGQNSGVLTSSRPKRLATQKAYLLRMLPGVGPKLAKTLLNEFETIQNIVKANRDDLERIPGLGKKKADKIFQVLHEDHAGYDIS